MLNIIICKILFAKNTVKKVFTKMIKIEHVLNVLNIVLNVMGLLTNNVYLAILDIIYTKKIYLDSANKTVLNNCFSQIIKPLNVNNVTRCVKNVKDLKTMNVKSVKKDTSFIKKLVIILV